jgi:hypothetical protein
VMRLLLRIPSPAPISSLGSVPFCRPVARSLPSSRIPESCESAGHVAGNITCFEGACDTGWHAGTTHRGGNANAKASQRRQRAVTVVLAALQTQHKRSATQVPCCRLCSLFPCSCAVLR